MADDEVKGAYIYDPKQNALRPATDEEISKKPEQLETIYDPKEVFPPQENIPVEKGSTTFREARERAGKDTPPPAQPGVDETPKPKPLGQSHPVTSPPPPAQTPKPFSASPKPLSDNPQSSGGTPTPNTEKGLVSSKEVSGKEPDKK